MAEASPRVPDLAGRSEAAALVAILAGVSAALHVGKLAPALPALRDALQIDLLQAGFLLSTVQLAGMSLGLVIGLTADTWGLRRTLLSGMVILCVASTLGAFAHSAWMLLGLRAVEGLGFLLVAMPAPALIRQLVPLHHLSRMLGLWGGYMPTGTALALLIGPLWIGVSGPWGGWSGWWLLLAGTSCLMIGMVWRWIPSDAQRLPEVAKPKVAIDWRNRLRLTLHSPGPWLVSLCFAVYAGQWLAVVGFLPSIYTQSGVAGKWIGVLTALVAAANIVGNVASGRLLQRAWSPVRLLQIGYLAMAAGTLLCFGVIGDGWSAPPAVRYAAVLLFSGVGGLIPGTLFSLAVRLAPSDSTVSTTVGWMQQLSCVGQFTGPPLVAWVAQAVGGWQWTWVVTGTCSAVGLILVQQVQRSLESKTASDQQEPEPP